MSEPAEAVEPRGVELSDEMLAQADEMADAILAAMRNGGGMVQLAALERVLFSHIENLCAQALRAPDMWHGAVYVRQELVFLRTYLDETLRRPGLTCSCVPGLPRHPDPHCPEHYDPDTLVAAIAAQEAKARPAG